jgi:hypothetical protein
LDGSGTSTEGEAFLMQAVMQAGVGLFRIFTDTLVMDKQAPKTRGGIALGQCGACCQQQPGDDVKSHHVLPLFLTLSGVP